jgi:hypothetical protein
MSWYERRREPEVNYEWYSSEEGMSEAQFRALFGVPKDMPPEEINDFLFRRKNKKLRRWLRRVRRKVRV